VEIRDFLLRPNENFSTRGLWKVPRFSTGENRKNFDGSFPQKIFSQSTGAVEIKERN